MMVEMAEESRARALKPKKPLTMVDVLKVPYYRRAAELLKWEFEARGKLASEVLDDIHWSDFKEATVGDKKAKVRQMVPTFDNVLVKRDEAAERSPGGILMPDVAKDKPKRGVVVAVGPGRHDKEGRWVEPPCKAGDIVFVRHWNGADVLIGNVPHEIFNAAEIISVETDNLEQIEKAYGKTVKA
jgi:chaperonin GroES